MGTVFQAYRFVLDPTPEQEVVLRSNCGAQRFAFNWGLGLVKANLAQREAERSYGIAEELLTPAVSWSAYGLRKLWNQVKDAIAPWWTENSKETYSSGLADLAQGLKNWADSRNGTRKGAKVRFPRGKSKHRARARRFPRALPQGFRWWRSWSRLPPGRGIQSSVGAVTSGISAYIATESPSRSA